MNIDNELVRLTGLAWALHRAKDRAGIAVDDLSQDILLTELIQQTSGTHPDVPGQKVCRPWYAAAKFHEQNLDSQSISEASGVRFTNLTTVIASLLLLQNGIDEALGIQVPLSLRAIPPSALIKNGSSVSGRGSQSVRTRISI